ncbi:rhomboid protease [Entamoeba marina]
MNTDINGLNNVFVENPFSGVKSDTSVVITNNASDSSSSDESYSLLAFSNILFPQSLNENEEGFIDIDGYISPYQTNANVLFQLLYALFPCLIPPFINNTKLEKYMKGMLSVSFIICCSLVVVFIVELCTCGVTTFRENPGFGPTTKTIVDFGAKYPFAIKQEYEIYRLFTSIFLSPSLISLCLEILLSLRLLLYLEHRWGILVFVTSYFITGEAGVLLSCVLSSNNVSVSSIGPFAGLVTIFIIDLSLTNTKGRTNFKQFVFSALVMMLMIVLITFFPLVDLSCIIGSVVIGVFLGIVFFVHSNKWFTKQSIIFQGSVYFFVICCVLLFFISCCLLLFVWIEPLTAVF